MYVHIQADRETRQNGMNDEDTEWKVWRCGGQQSRIDKETKQEQNTYVYTNSSIKVYSYFVLCYAKRMKWLRLVGVQLRRFYSCRFNCKYLFIDNIVLDRFSFKYFNIISTYTTCILSVRNVYAIELLACLL